MGGLRRSDEGELAEQARALVVGSGGEEQLALVGAGAVGEAPQAGNRQWLAVVVGGGADGLAFGGEHVDRAVAEVADEDVLLERAGALDDGPWRVQHAACRELALEAA